MGAGQQFGGIVEAVDGSVLTLSSDIEAEGEHWYCILRDRHGEPSAPLPIEVVAPNRVRVLDTLPYIETDTSREPTHYLIGQGAKVSWPVKVTAISPEADNKITIAGCIESEFVHSADEGVLPPPTAGDKTTATGTGDSQPAGDAGRHGACAGDFSLLGHCRGGRSLSD